MIIGIGTDIINIGRISRLLLNHKERFVKKILSTREIKIFSEIDDLLKPRYLAKRFAAKEAFTKALGLGIGRPIGFNDIEVLNDSMGKPLLNLLNYQSMIKNYIIHVSLSDDSEYGVAFIVISLYKLDQSIHNNFI
jgi:holo-[acyl-carrier protein] synthase